MPKSNCLAVVVDVYRQFRLYLNRRSQSGEVKPCGDRSITSHRSGRESKEDPFPSADQDAVDNE